MVVSRTDIKRKRKDDSCLNVDVTPKRTKVHAQRKFAQGSNVSSPVITPVKEIERQERNKDVLPEPIEFIPMKRPNTEDFLTFLCFRGTPILPSNLNFFNAACMEDSRSQTDESKTTYQKNGPILTTVANKSQTEKPFIAFGVRKRADPVVISKQMDRKRRHALALQVLRRKYQEQKMAKIRAVTINKLSERVSHKNIVRTRSITRNEITSKKSVTHKVEVKVVTGKHAASKANIKQPIKSKMCLRSFRGRYVHRELNIIAHRKNRQISTKHIKTTPITKIKKGKSSSDFSSDDDEPLVKSVKRKMIKKKSTNTLIKPIQSSKKYDDSNIRLTRSHNKVLNIQSPMKHVLKHRKIITRLSANISTTPRIKNKKIIQTPSSVNGIKSINSVKINNQEVSQFIRSTRQHIKDKIEKSYNASITQTRSKSNKQMDEKIEKLKQNEIAIFKRTDKTNVKNELKSINSNVVIMRNNKPYQNQLAKRNNKQRLQQKLKIMNQQDIVLETITNSNSNSAKKCSKKVEKLNVFVEKCKKQESINIETKTPREKYKHNISIQKSDNISNCRPSRKTKEAAAIYMELLGHKLVNGTEIDDDESIESFPELPNVRRTEQRENELKAKAKPKSMDNKCTNKNKEQEIISVRKQIDQPADNIKGEIHTIFIYDKSKSSITNSKKEIQKELNVNVHIANEIPTKDTITEKQQLNFDLNELQEGESTNKSTLNNDVQFLTVNREESYNDKNDECKIYRQINPNIESVPQSSNCTSTQISTIQIASECFITNRINPCTHNDLEYGSVSEFDHIDNKSYINKNTTFQEKIAFDQNFSDSDEEPLSNLTKSKDKINQIRKEENVHSKIVEVINPMDINDDNLHTEKLRHECTKTFHSYLPFSSSDDDEKYFHGFVKTELKATKELKFDTEKCAHSLPSDLSCKDVSRRYGKGKVNMSNEQIEKWLNDSAIAGMNLKKEEDDMLKYEEKMSPTEVNDQVITTAILSSSTTKFNQNDFKTSEETLSLTSTPEKTILKVPTKLNEKKTIFKKEKTEHVRNVNAFSASNECSVYAFEADNEDSISTPFRRPCRRPSSTATSKSEDENKMDDTKYSGKFRLPSMLRNEFKSINKQEFLTTAQDDCNNSNIAVQANLENQTFTDNSNSESPSIIEDGEQIFYTLPQFNKSATAEGNGKLISGNTYQKSLRKLKSNIYSKISQPPEKPNEEIMFPPSQSLQRGKTESKLVKPLISNKCSDKAAEIFEDVKYKIPSSPSASSSSSAKLYKRQSAKTRNRLVDFYSSMNTTEFPNIQSASQIVEALTFHPTDKEFQDPLEYIEKIRSKAEKFGICRIVPPPNFKPECKVSDDMRFTAYNQYVHKMLHRWGPNFKELMAIKKYLETQNISFTRPPWIGGMEIDLPRLYQTVQSLGGLKDVIEKKKWPKVSEAMKIPKSAQDRVTKLDDIYCKYLLPYDTLSTVEREKLFDEVETEWAKKESKALLKVQRANKLEYNNADADSDSDGESEECIVKGRNIALNAFYRIARNTMSMWFKTPEPSAEEVEQEFWKHVTIKNNHICVHSGSIDSGNWGYGFAVSKNSPFARHAWNLKVLTNNSGSVLRSMSPVMGVTVPTLHVGMVFSTCCWYRDPHSLPWIEYLHTGAHKIWYGIPDSMSKQFHNSMLKLAPNYCRNKSIWLSSDTVMIPPKLLVENGVSLCRTVQEPGQFIVVFPKAFTSSVSTGYVVSESVYFAPPYWLQSAQSIFDELRQNCEPSMFSIDRLLLSIVSDTRSSAEVLKQIIPAIQELCNRERGLRSRLFELGLKSIEKLPPPEVSTVRRRKKMQQDNGDYECEICRTNLFISLVKEYQEDAVYCLEHVIEYIEQKKIITDNCKLLFTYECEELDSLISKVENVIEIKLQKKMYNKVSSSLVKYV